MTRVEAIFSVTDRMGLSREELVVPLRPRSPGGVRRMPDGKLEIVVDAEVELGEYVAGLEDQIRTSTGG